MYYRLDVRTTVVWKRDDRDDSIRSRASHGLTGKTGSSQASNSHINLNVYIFNCFLTIPIVEILIIQDVVHMRKQNERSLVHHDGRRN